MADTPHPAKKAAPAKATGEGLKHFQGTVLKHDADGNEVLSDHIAAGEQRANDPEDEN